MKYDGDVGQQVLIVDVLHIHAANQNLPLLHIIETGDQLHHCAFPRPGNAHQCGFCPLGDAQTAIPQNIPFAIIGEADIAQFDVCLLWKRPACFKDGEVQDHHEGGIGRGSPAGHLVPDGVFLPDSVIECLEGLTAHVIGLDQPHSTNILDHHGVEIRHGPAGPLHDAAHPPEDYPHHHHR